MHHLKCISIRTKFSTFSLVCYFRKLQECIGNGVRRHCWFSNNCKQCTWHGQRWTTTWKVRNILLSSCEPIAIKRRIVCMVHSWKAYMKFKKMGRICGEQEHPFMVSKSEIFTIYFTCNYFRKYSITIYPLNRTNVSQKSSRF